MDLLWLDGDRLTTEDADLVTPPASAALTPASGPSALSTKNEFLDFPSRPPATYKRYLPEAAFPGSYEVFKPLVGMVYMVTPFSPSTLAISINRVIEGIVATLDRAVSQLLEHDAVLIPSIHGLTYEYEVRELATGFLLTTGTADPPTNPGDFVLLPPDSFGDFHPPLPIAGGPIRFFRFFPNTVLAGELGDGIRWYYDTDLNSLRVEGDPGAADAEVEAVLLNYDANLEWRAETGLDGSFQLQASGPLGQRWVLAIGAVIGAGEVPQVTFSENLDPSFTDLRILNQGTEVRLLPERISGTDTIRLVPLTLWLAGKSYFLELGPGLQDPLGNAWGRTLSVRFDIDQGDVLDTYALPAARDAARFGSWLFVAAENDGLRVLDISDPTGIKSVIRDDIGYPFQGPDPVMGVDVDPHGLVYVVGGGINNSGQLKILDPLLIEADAVADAAQETPPDWDRWFEAIRGSTLLSDKIGGGTGSQLPEGTPKRVSVLSNNWVDHWNLGQPAPDQEMVLVPTPVGWDLTIGGRALVNQEVVLENLDDDTALSAIADSEGKFQITLSVHTGDELKLTRPGNLVTLFRAGAGLSGDLWVMPWSEPQLTTLTVQGKGTPGHPVTLKNLSLGRWARVDADSCGGILDSCAGEFEISIEAYPGDEIELLRNQQTFAYVATRGIGIQVVDAGRLYLGGDSIQSHVIGNYSGYLDPSLYVCNESINDVGGAILDAGTLLDVDKEYPFTVAGLLAFKGFVLLDSDINNPGKLSFINQGCAISNGNGNIAGFEVVQNYPFDLNGNGKFDPDEYHDWILVAHRVEGILVYSITHRKFIVPSGQIRLPGDSGPANLELDRESRRLYVSAFGDGIHVVDFDLPPFFDVLDDNGDGVDDRVLETLEIGGNSNSDLLLVPEHGMVYAGGLDRGMTSLVMGAPKLVAVRNSVDGARRTLSKLAPFGVPTAPESISDPSSLEQPGSFSVLAYLPGFVGDEVTVEVIGLGPGGVEIDAPGDRAQLPFLPGTSLKAAEAVVLRRQAEHPWQEGYHIFESQEIVALADLRAAQYYERNDLEDEQCPRCDQPDYLRGRALEFLSGDTVQVRFTPESRALLLPVYGDGRLDEAELHLASVRWDVAPSTRQEPTINPSKGSGEVAPGTLLHSGEMTLSAVDLSVRGRGLDFTFQRSYRNQTVGSGPLGPGWDHTYRQRLRRLPNGDVEWYDGSGRRELFQRSADGGLTPPQGRFVDLTETAAGWVLLDSRRSTVRFDRFGRLASITDPFKDSADTGNEIVFYYDLRSRLETVVDSLDRVAKDHPWHGVHLCG